MTVAAHELANLLDPSDALSELEDEPFSIVAVDELAEEAWEDDAIDPLLDFLGDLDRVQLLEIIQQAIARWAHVRTHIRRCFRLLRTRAGAVVERDA